ncbi:large neutral amino acids transporter small subunit 1-like isoform X2 [Penaeus japonicus]|uniref:large neutral amino acids transporter small subunit 1-like isoform X2 n=1 Tax=Penaeus japonicus TaxID=27405 RepID=UPI001C714F2B|nr:large neutral amino acids transporter small subunit 1-like isoform X2 [Penaeus japonicus]XP_042875487.1 large neutral amino acids transporter small subunit 1-like isoform X2 [Penaeus japonicus]
MTKGTQQYEQAPTGEGEGEGQGQVVGLKPKMTLLNGITVIVGSIIGSGIFISPTGVLLNTGSVGMSLIVWVTSGLFSMIGAYCYAELGCMIQKTGADYAYIMIGFGPFLAFMRLWIECMIVRPCSQTIVALTFSVYIMKPFFPNCAPPDDAARLLAAVCILTLAFVNCWSVKWATRVQDIFTGAKLFALAVIIITGFVQLCFGHVEYFTFENTETDITKIALSFYSGLFAYNGWNYLNFVIEELKDPVQNLPKAIYISISLVTVVYVLTNVAFYTTLSPAEVLGSEAVAVTFANRLFGYMAWIMPVFVACSTFGAVNGVLLTSSRLFYAGALEGQMPEILTMIQVKRMTPTPAVIVMAFLSLAYLGSSNIFALISYVGFATWLSIGLGVFCVPLLRYTHPDLERPIKVNLVWPILYIIATIFITVVPMIAAPKETGIGVGMIATGAPVYLLFIYLRKPEAIKRMLNKCTEVVQKMMMVLPAEKGNS